MLGKKTCWESKYEEKDLIYMIYRMDNKYLTAKYSAISLGQKCTCKCEN